VRHLTRRPGENAAVRRDEQFLYLGHRPVLVEQSSEDRRKLPSGLNRVEFPGAVGTDSGRISEWSTGHCGGSLTAVHPNRSDGVVCSSGDTALPEGTSVIRSRSEVFMLRSLRDTMIGEDGYYRRRKIGAVVSFCIAWFCNIQVR
jgi:hypothetical protein